MCDSGDDRQPEKSFGMARNALGAVARRLQAVDDNGEFIPGVSIELGSRPHPWTQRSELRLWRDVEVGAG